MHWQCYFKAAAFICQLFVIKSILSSHNIIIYYKRKPCFLLHPALEPSLISPDPTIQLDLTLASQNATFQNADTYAKRGAEIELICGWMDGCLVGWLDRWMDGWMWIATIARAINCHAPETTATTMAMATKTKPKTIIS